MRREGAEPDTVSYNAAISACEKAAKWKHALDPLSSMRREGAEADYQRKCMSGLLGAP